VPAQRGLVWKNSEVKCLLENYHNKTIFELMKLLPNRSQEAINNKIKRLKKEGKLSGSKYLDAVSKSYRQRGDKKMI
jgi:N-methylhydantoinase B/oxoprolinase/acetone carboxylase alpha subunit